MARTLSTFPEASRDQVETMFTPVLRRLFEVEPHIRALVFVDRDGECVDYCSAIDPFEAKVLGAHLQMVVAGLAGPLHRLAAGEAVELAIYGDRLDLVARRVDDDYTLIVAVRAGMTDESVQRGIEELVGRLRSVAGLPAPWWDGGRDGLDVRTRDAVGWDYAPVAVVHEGRAVHVADVLGRWEEEGGVAGGVLVCFRVRTTDHRELTLARDVRSGRWYSW